MSLRFVAAPAPGATCQTKLHRMPTVGWRPSPGQSPCAAAGWPEVESGRSAILNRNVLERRSVGTARNQAETGLADVRTDPVDEGKLKEADAGAGRRPGDRFVVDSALEEAVSSEPVSTWKLPASAN
jgi:hypothetical protein